MLWRCAPTPCLSGYYVTPDARIFSNRSGKLREKSTTLHNHGYYVTSIELGGGKRHGTYMLHKLVAETYLERPRGADVVNHKDGDKTNNNLYNLEYVTQAYNVYHYRQVEVDGYITDAPPMHTNTWWK